MRLLTVSKGSSESNILVFSFGCGAGTESRNLDLPFSLEEEMAAAAEKLEEQEEKEEKARNLKVEVSQHIFYEFFQGIVNLFRPVPVREKVKTIHHL